MASRNAKSRMIYWKISYSKQLVRCSILSKLLFTWLIPNTDDLGRMEGDPEIVKGMVFPYDEKITLKQIRDSLEELAKENLILWYRVDENQYIQFPNFLIYQKLRSDRVYKSDYPSPLPLIRNCDDLNADCMTCHDMSCHVGQNMREEKRREGEEKEKRSEVKGGVPYQEIQEMFNRICISLPSIKTLSKGRKDKIKTRWSEIRTLETFEEICNKMQSSNFLKGDNNKKWKATFDWILENDNNWVKIIEGNYNNKSQGTNGVKQPEINSRDSKPWETDPYIQALRRGQNK